MKLCWINVKDIHNDELRINLYHILSYRPVGAGYVSIEMGHGIVHQVFINIDHLDRRMCAVYDCLEET